MLNPKEAFIIRNIAAMQPTFSAPQQAGITGRTETDTDASEGLPSPYSWVRIGDSRAASPCINTLFARNAANVPVYTAIRLATGEREITAVRVGESSSLPPATIEKIVNPGAQPVESNELTPGMVHPDQSGGLTVYIRAYAHSYGTWIGGTLSVATEVGALSSGASALLKIGNIEATNTPYVVVGTEQSLAWDYQASDVDAVILPAHVTPLWALVIRDGQTNISDCYNTDKRQFDIRQWLTRSGVLPISTANVTTPTDAELDSAFGTPATVGAGFAALVNDNGAGTSEYLVWSDGTNWFFIAGTKAT